MKTSPVGYVVQNGVEPDYEKLPAGHYGGRGTRQERTGPNGPFLERGPARFERRPEAVDRGPRRGRGPRNYVRSDERIFEDVCEALADDPDLDASELEVSVDQGVVTLTGWVETGDDRDYAMDLASDVLGVADVVDWVRVRRVDESRTRPIVR